MYHCYLRGKQNELLAVREAIAKIVEAKMTIIVEPVKQNERDLLACVECIKKNNADFILIVNPCVVDGELTGNEAAMDLLMKKVIEKHPNISLGIIVNQMTSVDQLEYFFKKYPKNQFTLVHSGELRIEQNFLLNRNISKNIFFSQFVSLAYIKQFDRRSTVIIKDGFEKKNKNADYRLNLNELFLDLQDIISECNQNDFKGFGDFSIVGDNYSITGSQPVTVAIHLTYNASINNETNIYIHHFLSEDRVSREETHVLIEEAFKDVLNFIKTHPDINILEWSEACREIKEMYKSSKSTSLGYLKKLSIKHHFELMHHLYMEHIL